MLRKDVQEELATIQQQHGGLLRPADVVAFARNPETALHHCFTWDDTEAAEKYRLNQARAVIRLSVTVVGEDADPVRALVSLSSDRRSGGGYRALVDVMSDEAQRAEMLADALNDLRILRRKYQRLEALAPVWNAAEAVEGASTKAA